MRGDRLKASATKGSLGEDENPALIRISDYRPKPMPSPLWRECIRKVFEVDPLICPSCKSEMRIISFVEDRQVIRKILECLGVYSDLPERKRAPPVETAMTELTISEEPVDDGWPAYEEPWVPVRV